MKFTLVRSIYFESPSAGLVAKYVSKEIDSEVPPQVGFQFEDSAWHRNDPITAESISIDSDSGQCTVNLNPKKVELQSDVDRFYNLVIEHHGWKNRLEG